MTARRHVWIRGLAKIGAYLEMDKDEVGALLRSGEIKGHQKRPGGTWRTCDLWLDAYMAGEEPPQLTGRRTA